MIQYLLYLLYIVLVNQFMYVLLMDTSTLRNYNISYSIFHKKISVESVVAGMSGQNFLYLLLKLTNFRYFVAQLITRHHKSHLQCFNGVQWRDSDSFQTRSKHLYLYLIDYLPAV